MGNAGFAAVLACILVTAGSPVLAAESLDGHSPVTISRFFWTLMTGASALGLTEDQVERLHSLAASYHVALHRAEQDIGRAQRALHRILEDDTLDLTATGAKLKEIETVRTCIQLISIKAWRDARGVLTAEQRETLRAFHAIPRMPEGRPLDHRKPSSIVNDHSSIAYEERGGP
jgi:Spy/CpxP family protein refolding chaperone